MKKYEIRITCYQLLRMKEKIRKEIKEKRRKQSKEEQRKKSKEISFLADRFRNKE